MSTPAPRSSRVVRTGADRLLVDAPELIRGKNIGILTNQTGRLSDGRSIIDAIVDAGICRVKALFGPEHGITGDMPNGVRVEHAEHARYAIPIYSLYGRVHKPSRQMLNGVNVLLCDIQDVGARSYTFISTIALAMEASAEQDIQFILLDRPNPIRGLDYDGPVRVPSLKSFVGWMPMPVTHGLTIGELARLWNEERWLTNGVEARLEVVPIEGWKRSVWFDETGLPWIPPSPNMQTLATAVLYPGLCFVEGTSISEGRGTCYPFQLVGAPWADPAKIMSSLEKFETSGVTFSPEEYTPHEIPGVANQPKYAGMRCRGIRITVLERDNVRPVRLGVAVLAAFKRAHPAEALLRHRRLDILTGNPAVRYQLDKAVDPEEIYQDWAGELEAFGRKRAKYVLYSSDSESPE
jgi:uncharacterized protein YbbC (DUF1343 family)